MRTEYKSVTWTDTKVDHILALDRRRTGRQLSNILDEMHFLVEKLPIFLLKEKKQKEAFKKVYNDFKKLQIDLLISK